MKMQVRKKQVQMCKDGQCKYGQMKYDWAGMENASTNSAGKVKHNNSRLLTDYIKKWQVAVTSFFKLVWHFKKSAYDKIQC